MTVLPLLLALGAATVGGVFFAFSNFVMGALGRLPPAQGIAAMQQINRVVLNIGFLGLFVGTALLAVVCVAAALLPAARAQPPALTAAALLYLVGCFGVTAAFNVPRNERLAKLDADGADAAAYWPAYRREWQRWNHVRTAAALAAAVLAGATLAG